MGCHKKQDFWTKINVLEGNNIILWIGWMTVYQKVPKSTTTASKLCLVKKDTKLNQIFCLRKSSEISLIFKRSHSVSERFYISICPSVRAFVRPSLNLNFIKGLHNQQLCQFMCDWLLRLALEFWSKSLQSESNTRILGSSKFWR